MASDAVEQAARQWSQEHIHTCCCGGIGFVRTNAPLGHILFGKAIPCVCQIDRQAREMAMRLRRESGMSDEEFARWSFDTWKPEWAFPKTPETKEAMVRAKETCLAYAKAPKGWLLITGTIGSGKTHLAMATAHEAINLGRHAVAMSVPSLLNLLRSGYDQGNHLALLRDVSECDLLVLDDLGSERPTEWQKETLYEIVNHRYSKLLPMIVTTNVDVSKSGPLDPRVASRITDGAKSAHGLVRLIHLPCADFRQRGKG